MDIISRSVLIGYNKCDALVTKWKNILDSFWHKNEGQLVKSHLVLENGDIEITYTDDTKTTIGVGVVQSLISGAENGLTKDALNVQLGGALSKNTAIDLSTYVLNIVKGNVDFSISENQISIEADNIPIQTKSLVVGSNDVNVTAKNLHLEATEALIVKPLSSQNAPIGSVLTKIDGNDHAQYRPVYVPSFSLTDIGSNLLLPSTSVVKNLKGNFMDTITEVVFEGLTDNSNTTASIVSKSPNEIYIELSPNATTQIYKLTLKSAATQIELLYESEFYQDVIPSNSGGSPALWVLPAANNNNAIVSGGVFDSPNVSGDGWNDHAYFGSVNSATKIRFSFTIDRLLGVAGAYCYVKLDSSNIPSTGGGARLYIENATTLKCYDPDGNSISTTTIKKNDFIEVIYTSTRFEVFVNNVSVGSSTGNYTLDNIYANFTSFRITRLTNISLKVF